MCRTVSVGGCVDVSSQLESLIVKTESLWFAVADLAKDEAGCLGMEEQRYRNAGPALRSTMPRRPTRSLCQVGRWRGRRLRSAASSEAELKCCKSATASIPVLPKAWAALYARLCICVGDASFCRFQARATRRCNGSVSEGHHGVYVCCGAAHTSPS